MSDVKVYGYMMRIKEGLQVDQGIFCTSMDKVILFFQKEEAEEKIIKLRSGDIAKSSYKDEDGYTYLVSISVDEDKIISEKEGVMFGYRLALTLQKEKEKGHE